MVKDRATSADGLSICSRARNGSMWGCSRYEETDEEVELTIKFYPDTGDSADEALVRFEQERQQDFA